MDANIEPEEIKRSEKLYGSCPSVILDKVKSLNIKRIPKLKVYGILHGLKYISYSHSMVAFGLGDRS